MQIYSRIVRASRASLAWLFVTVLFAGILCLLLFLRKPAVLPEVLSTELTRRDGLLYHGQQTQPFTGFILEEYPSGGRKSRSAIRDGVLDGLSEGWHGNGRPQVREFFRTGVSHGRREKWFENGVKASESSIVEGKHHGAFRRWHENGALAEEVTMRQGEPEGLSLAFYPSGFLKARVTLRNGKVVEQKSWADGELKAGPALVSSQ